LIGEDPALVKEMFDQDAEMTINMMEMLDEPDLNFEYDGVWIWGDIAYNKGMLFSPRAYRELLMPAHKRIFDFCHARGKPVVHHCDGKLVQVLPLLIEAGIDAIHPIEVKAGNDVLQIKRQYGERLTLIGGIDARLMVDRQAIEQEMREKMPVLKAGGRYIWYSDHSVPPDVSFSGYRHIMSLLDELGGYQATGSQ
jgi:uroporphyrinogen decarboxylase